MKPKIGNIIIYGKADPGKCFVSCYSKDARYRPTLFKTERKRLDTVKEIVAEIVDRDTKH